MGKQTSIPAPLMETHAQFLERVAKQMAKVAQAVEVVADKPELGMDLLRRVTVELKTLVFYRSEALAGKDVSTRGPRYKKS